MLFLKVEAVLAQVESQATTKASLQKKEGRARQNFILDAWSSFTYKVEDEDLCNVTISFAPSFQGNYEVYRRLLN